MSDASHAPVALNTALVFLSAAVIAGPLFRIVGLGATVGYLAAGAVIGPAGLALISNPAATLAFSELGVVLLLFVVGLELEAAKLWAMRKQILGLGAGQMAVCAVAIGLAGWALGLGPAGAGLVGVAFAFSATSIALQSIEERGASHSAWGRRALSILLFQDVSVAPVLALAPLLAGQTSEVGWAQSLVSVAMALGAVGLLIVGGLKLLNPFFGLLARYGGRGVMTAAALFVVLGAAAAMDRVGLSMALGAFLAGLLLSGSHFRHQVEADIEPFRSLLMGLFFLSVGMSIDSGVVAANLGAVIAVTLGVIALKLVLTALVLRTGCSTWREAAAASGVLTPAGEFAFVVFPLAAQLRLIPDSAANICLAASAVTMLVGPVVAKMNRVLAERYLKTPAQNADDLLPQDETGSVLVIGFGRFGQIANQVLLAAGLDVTVIDKNVERIRQATRFGFKVFYGDGARLDVLRAAGAGRAAVIAILIDDKAAAVRVAEMARTEFPEAKIYARAYDRVHSIELLEKGVDFELRETFESALIFGAAVVAELDGDDARSQELIDHTRQRDVDRLRAQREEGRVQAGGDYVYREPVRPEPLTPASRAPKALSDETQAIVEGASPARQGAEEQDAEEMA
jgi:monovalent cation:proton antiporter-2 (CPA2) family protein